MSDLINRTDAAIMAVESGTATREQVVAALDFTKSAKLAVSELDRRMKDAAIEWIKTNGDLIVGDIRYYVGTDRDYRCRDNRAAMEAILKATDGDFDKAMECLAAGAWKPGMTKKIVGDADFAKLFETRTPLDLKTGKPKRGLKVLDQKFIKDKELDE